MVSPLRADLNLYVGQLTPAQKSAAPIKHALAVQRAMSTGNYHLLCDLFCTCPNMGGYIMDHFIARERVRALIVMAKACVPSYYLETLFLSLYASQV